VSERVAEWVSWALDGVWYVSRIDPATGAQWVVRVTDRQEGDAVLAERARAVAAALNRVYASDTRA
jgi:hypothetical protein